jgi:Peptidase family S41/N-terminal domain of Peptidase_S41 in eukaryotic IRBP
MKAALVSLASGLLIAQGPVTSLDASLVRSTVQSLTDVISREYFDVPVAAKVEVALKTALAEGRYASSSTPEDLARALTRDLYAVTHDKHLAVAVKPAPAVAPAAGGRPAAQRDQPTEAGFRHVEILPGNIGYLDLTMFLRLTEHRDALAAAMKKLQPARALILDMRDNGGGSPDTVVLLMSYLFDQPSLPLLEIIPRSGETQAYATAPAGAGIERNGARPVFVLTSSHTFSGGEGLAYLLQERKRALVIGEKTAGAANPGRPYPVNEILEVTVPNGSIRSALKRSNWEGGGVTPDVIVPAATALDVALERARMR